MFHIGWYGMVVGLILLVKLGLSFRSRSAAPPQWKASGDVRLAAVITVYNEAPETLVQCLRSLVEQTRPPELIHITDDGSDEASYHPVWMWLKAEGARRGIEISWVRTENRGKRHALASGFERAWDADVYCCIDSDTVLEPDAVEQALKPFGSQHVHAVTGLIMARNRATNILTRLIDMRYVNAFLGERVAYARLGSVLCVCGSLALYRGWVVRKYLDDFLGQTFLGRPATAGDDRRMTYYALREGQAVIQPLAVARTDVPDNMGHYIRQQVRWTKSFIREGFLLLLQGQLINRAFWWLNLIELVTWSAFTMALVVAIGVVFFHPFGVIIGLSYLAYMCLMAWVRSVHYLRKAVGIPGDERFFTFLVAPVYALMNLGVLVPLRFWALLTLRDTRWGTRSKIEVVNA